jgi:hypothetical protein
MRKGDPFKGRVLYVGQCYYNAWYLSRELRKIGWKADLLNWDPNTVNGMYYHGEDFTFRYHGRLPNLYSFLDLLTHLNFYRKAIKEYDIFHFSNAHCIKIGTYTYHFFKRFFCEYFDIKLLKKLGKKIVYTNNGCSDGVSQSSFRQWGQEPVCNVCAWRDRPEVCSDGLNLEWGRIRNELADYQILLGGNRVDYNDDPTVHEVPEFYCLDHHVWHPDLLLPANYRLPLPSDSIKIYHAVGNMDSRTSLEGNVNIKSTHIYIPLIERLKREGYNVELIFFHDVPNQKLKYYQLQADIFVDI